MFGLLETLKSMTILVARLLRKTWWLLVMLWLLLLQLLTYR